MMYTLMVQATSDDDLPQSASDVVGPITLTGGTAKCKLKCIATYTINDQPTTQHVYI